MSGITNGDGSRITDLFGVPADGYYNSGAPGSRASRTPGRAVELSGESGLPNVGLPLPLAQQMDDTGCASTEQPGQNDGSPIMGDDADGDYTDSGAGYGHTDAWGRFDWQQART